MKIAAAAALALIVAACGSSSGEGGAAVAVEDALCRHPAVMLAAVVAMPDAKWGEVPCGFVELKPQGEVTEPELIEFCRGLLARFKVKDLKGTPAMFVVAPDGKLRNKRKDALSWRNAESRGAAATLDWFRKLKR